MEATTTRASTVIRSMPTSEMRTQASITMPLSSTRSSTSMRLDPPDTRSTAISNSSYIPRDYLVRRLGRTTLFVLDSLIVFLVDCGGNAGRFLDAPPCNPLLVGAVRFGSCFHQFRPISSALSTEQTNRRIL